MLWCSMRARSSAARFATSATSPAPATPQYGPRLVASRLRTTGVVPWALAGVGAAMPFLAGPGLARGLHDLSEPVRTTASVALWVAWGVGLLAAVVPHPVALTTVRVLAPAGVAAALIVRGDGTAWVVGV